MEPSSRDLRDLASAARQQDLDYVRNLAQRERAALTNRAYAMTLSGGTFTAPTIATPSIYTTIVLVAKVSGLFVVQASGTATVGAVETAGATIALTGTLASTAGATITPSNGIATGSGVYNSNSTTAIALAASTGSLAANNLAEETNLNGLASSSEVFGFGFAGIFGTGSGATAVPVGSSIAYSLVVQVATTTIVLSNFNFSAFELPA